MRPLFPTVLMYHGVPRGGRANALNNEAFASQMAWLRRHCAFISWHELSNTRISARRPPVLLTFDDGFGNNASVVAPILRHYRIPAVFFVTLRHCVPGQFLWFTYLRMLSAFYPEDSVSVRGQVFGLDRKQRPASMSQLTSYLLGLQPHPKAMYDAITEELPPLETFVEPEVLADECAGMTFDEVRQLANEPLFAVGGHTVDHPMLTRCSHDELYYQVVEGTQTLAEVTGRRCQLFAYPAGEYDQRVVQCCRSAGLSPLFAELAEDRTIDAHFSVRRLGIYSRSLVPLAMKLWTGNWFPARLVSAVNCMARAAVRAQHRLIVPSASEHDRNERATQTEV